MRPTEFTDEAIISAGDELLKSGRKVTGFGLRNLLGGGKSTRLKDVWDAHVASKETVQLAPELELPVDLAEVVASTAKELGEKLTALAITMNTQAVKAAERRVVDVQRASSELREQTDRELADASDAVDDLERTLEDQKSAYVSVQATLKETSEAGQRVAVELATMRERNATLEDALAKANDQIRQLMSAAESAKDMATAQTLEMGALRDRLQTTGDAITEGQRVIELLRADLAECRQQGATALDAAHSSVAALESDLRHAREEADTRIQELKRTCDQALAREAEAQKQASLMQGQLAATERHCAELMAAIKESTGRQAVPATQPKTTVATKKTKGTKRGDDQPG